MNFEIIPSDPNEALIYYREKLKSFEISAKEISEQGYEIPEILMSLGCNYSANIRNLEKRLQT